MDIERRKLLKQQAKTQAAEEAAAMAQREADRDEALWTFIRDHLTRATPEQRHMYVASSNYDDNERGIRFLADLPDLEQGTAVMLFWLKGADALARLTPTEMASYQEDAWELIKLIEQRVVNGFYRTGTIRFDPANCPLYPGEYASLGPLVHHRCMPSPKATRMSMWKSSVRNTTRDYRKTWRRRFGRSGMNE